MGTVPDSDWETPCPDSPDDDCWAGGKCHCNCWYDGEACCYCSDPKIDDED